MERQSKIPATPIAYDGRVYIAPGQYPEHNWGEGELFCIDPSGAGDVSAELDDGTGKGAECHEVGHEGNAAACAAAFDDCATFCLEAREALEPEGEGGAPAGQGGAGGAPAAVGGAGGAG